MDLLVLAELSPGNPDQPLGISLQVQQGPRALRQEVQVGEGALPALVGLTGASAA